MFLTKTNARVKRFIKNKDGASAIEYVIIVAMVALVLVALAPGVKTAIDDAFGKITTALGTNQN